MTLSALLKRFVFSNKITDQKFTASSSDDNFLFCSIGDQIRFAEKKTIQAWHYVKDASSQYCQALNMSSNDIETLEDLNGYVSVLLFNKQTIQQLPENIGGNIESDNQTVVLESYSFTEVRLIPKNTCGAPYGGGWEHLLQPRLPNGELPGFGGGTSYIAGLPPEINNEIIKAIKAGRVTIKKGRIWP